MSTSTEVRLSTSRPTVRWAASGRRRVLLVAATGLGVGILTSFGQTILHPPLHALVNSASAWMVAPFLIGAVMATRRGAGAAGLVVCALELFGYYATAHVRGYAAGGSIVVFWALCGSIGGPLFGAAGYAWRTARRRHAARGIGATLLPAAFLAEGLWVYLYELHDLATTALWAAIGVVLAWILPREFAERRWLMLTFLCGIAGEIALNQIYRQAL